ncbi:MAG: hypothetical protein ABIH74_00260, partial [Candidatus Omnitrophota bacterium]
MNKDVGKKKIYGLLGKNISYSLSPVMHNAAFGDDVYEIFDRQENELTSFFEEYVDGGKLSGFNVTDPYKIIVKETLEKKFPECCKGSDAEIVGAVNTVKIDNGKITATNTDGRGFVESLKEICSEFSKPESFAGKNIFVIGA